MPLRPRPRPYKLPTTRPSRSPRATTAAWLDALGGVVKRVPVTDEDSNVVDHVLVPVVGGKIEGGAPDKVFYFRCPDDALRGYRVHAGDLLLCVPAQKVEDGAISLFLLNGRRRGAQGQQAGREPRPFAELRPRVHLADAPRRRSAGAGQVRKAGTEAVTCGFSAICTSTPACRPAATN